MQRNQPLRLLILSLFFLSGISGLVYQIVWTRMLVLVFGNTLLAAATVLSAFMAGLAAGSFVLGEYIDRKPRRLLKLYAVLEGGIGLFGLAFPLLVAGVAPLYTALYQNMGENLGLLNFLRFAICFVLIVLPTFFMGGTLPVLVKHFAGDVRKIGYQLGFLYGLNTVGAVIGCVVAGYWLLGVVGMQRTTWIAVTINLVVGLIAWLLPDSASAPQSPDVAAQPETGETEEYGRPVVIAVLIGIGLSGFCALAYEVLWARMLNLFLNNNIYSFTATIATFLVGIAVGSLIYAWFLAGIKSKLTLFAGIEIGIGLLAYATPWLFTTLQGALFSKQSELLTMAKTAVVMIAPTILMGIAVPLAVQICQWGRGREGRSVGMVYAFNTVGSIFGSFLAGFILIPAVGLHMALILVASLNVGAGLLALAAGSGGVRRIGLAVGWAATIAVGVLAAPEAMFRDIYLQANPDSEIIHYKEGKVANVVVYDFEAGYKDLHLNGIEEASSRVWHVQLFKLLGVLPMMSHPDPEEALMIAFGAGMSAGASIEHASSLTVVDLNPDIYGPAEAFTRENLDVINNPKLKLVENDGRNALLLDPKKYSVIISDATNPKMFDSWTLYTQEFYQVTKDRLLPGGVFSQWLVYPLLGDSIKVILNTFRSVYPHMSLWCIHGSSQCLMLGTPERLDIDYLEFDRRLAPVLESSKFDEYGVTTTTKFLSFLLLGEDELGELLEGFDKVSTDDLPLPQFQVGREREGVLDSLNLLRYQNSILPYLRNLGPEEERIVSELEAHRAISLRLNLGFFLGQRNEYLKAAWIAAKAGFPDDANVASALRYDTERTAHFEKRVAEHPDDANVHNSLGYVYWHQGEHSRAIEHLERAIELAPEFANAWANLAQVYVAAGEYGKATSTLRELKELNPGANTLRLVHGQQEVIRLLRRLEYEGPTADLYRRLATAHAGVGDLLAALAAARNAEALLVDDPRAMLDLARFFEGTELVDEALEAYRRAAGMLPAPDPRLVAKIEELGALQANLPQRRARLLDRHADFLAQDAPTDDGHPESCALAAEAWNRQEFDSTVTHDGLHHAASLFEKSIAEKPDDFHAYLDAAQIYEILGDYNRAIEIWRMASAATEGSPTATRNIRRMELRVTLNSGTLDATRTSDALSEIGTLYQEAGDLDAAIASYEEVLAKTPAYPGGGERLAAAYFAAGRYPDAAGALEIAVAHEADAERLKRIEERLTAVRQILARHAQARQNVSD